VASFFCGSSAIVKRYVNETGSNFVDSLADLKIGNVILLARITRVEIAAAIARRLKGGSIATTDAQNALVAVGLNREARTLLSQRRLRLGCHRPTGV